MSEGKGKGKGRTEGREKNGKDNNKDQREKDEPPEGKRRLGMSSKKR